MAPCAVMLMWFAVMAWATGLGAVGRPAGTADMDSPPAGTARTSRLGLRGRSVDISTPFEPLLLLQHRRASGSSNDFSAQTKLKSPSGPVFEPSDPMPNPEVAGFCLRAGDMPACTAMPCCCWSTFADVSNPAYPNEVEARLNRQCLNPPLGYTYAPQPGPTFNDGHLNSVRSRNLPIFVGRSLCCLTEGDDPNLYSMRFPTHAIQAQKQAATNAVMVGTTTLAAVAGGASSAPTANVLSGSMPTSAPLNIFTTKTFTTTELLAGQDYETMQMEAAARAHLTAADDLTRAAAALNTSTDALENMEREVEASPAMARKRARIARMREALREWSKKRWENIRRLSVGDFNNMVR